MAKITLDKNLETEKVFNVHNVSENPLINQITGNFACVLDGSSVVPTFPNKGDGTFTTVHIENDLGIEIPVVGSYNIITNYVMTYIEDNKIFNFHIALGYEE